MMTLKSHKALCAFVVIVFLSAFVWLVLDEPCDKEPSEYCSQLELIDKEGDE